MFQFSQIASAVAPAYTYDPSQPVTLQGLERNDGDGANSAGTPKDPGNGIATIYMTQKQAGQTVNQIGGIQTKPKGEVCTWPSWGSHPINCSLLLVLDFSGALLSTAATLFAWVIDVNNLKGVINGEVIYPAWQLVRDFLNVGFIMLLLYAAFSIIFQVGGKFGEKKIILTIILMALLVNFSFPITRFIIDISNSLMYTLLQNLGFNGSTPDKAIGIITDNSGIKAIMTPGADAPTTYILMAIVFVFILAITLLSFGVLLVVRMIALAILIIFSPVAFVGSIFGKGGQWWTYLFDYAFFGPIMVFMLSLAVQISAIQSDQIQASFKKLAKDQSADPNIIGSMAYFAIPIVILWIGMSVSKKMSGEGGKLALDWSKKGAGYAWSAAKYGAGSTGIPGGFKKAADYYGKKGAPGFLGKIPGLRGSEATENTEAGIAGFLTKGTKGYSKAQENIKRKRIAARQKEFEDERLSATEAEGKMQSRDEIEKKAAALYLSKKDKIDSSTRYELAMKALAGDDELQKELTGKTKKDNNVKFIIDYDVNVKRLSKKDAYENNLGNLSPENLAKQKGLHDDIKTDADLKSFITKSIKSIPASHQEFFSELTTKQQQAYRAEGLEPSIPTSAQQNNQQVGQSNRYVNKNRRRPQPRP